ncbi:MAG: glycosyl transferase family 90 [Oricola sp.]
MKWQEHLRYHRRLRRYRRYMLANFDQNTKSAGVHLPRPRLVFSKSEPFPLDAYLSRRNDRLFVDFTGPDASIPRAESLDKVAAYLYWLSKCPADIQRIKVNFSDGEKPSQAMFAPSSADPSHILVPDPHFFIHRGFERLRAFAETNRQPWLERSPVIRWRGGNTGHGRYVFSDQAKYDPTVLGRLRMILISKTIENFDASFVNVVDLLWMEHVLRFHGCFGSPIRETDWINDRYAVDIDGYTNTWTNFLVRLHLGCCVLKIDSQFGYRQWYYDRITPWEHFVPVKSDMSDLAQKIDWVRAHPSEAEAIARNGQAFARSMTFESETARAVAIITGAVRSGGTQPLAHAV